MTRRLERKKLGKNIYAPGSSYRVNITTCRVYVRVCIHSRKSSPAKEDKEVGDETRYCKRRSFTDLSGEQFYRPLVVFLDPRPQGICAIPRFHDSGKKRCQLCLGFEGLAYIRENITDEMADLNDRGEDFMGRGGGGDDEVN